MIGNESYGSFVNIDDVMLVNDNFAIQCGDPIPVLWCVPDGHYCSPVGMDSHPHPDPPDYGIYDKNPAFACLINPLTIILIPNETESFRVGIEE